MRRGLKNIIFPLVLCAALYSGRLHGQPYYFNHYPVESGLSNNSVECSIQDDDGFLWFGTINGLNRFDGYTFKTFYNDPADTNSIGSNFIRCLFNDRHGTIWVGTNKGVYTYNKIGEKFNLVKMLPKGNCTQIIGDAKGSFWAIIDLLVYRFSPETGQVKLFPMDERGAPVATSIAISPANELWVSTSNGCLRKFVPEADSFYTYTTYQGPTDPLPASIEKIYPVSDVSFLIGTKKAGLKLFDAVTKKFKEIITYNEEKTGIYVHSFIKWNETEYWIGTETGIYIYNSRTGAVSHLQREYDNPYSLSDNVIFAFCKDREGGLWVGTYLGGLNYLPERFVFFEKFFPRLTTPSISGNGVHEICKDQYGNFWIGTEDAGVDKVNVEKKTFTCFKPTSVSGSIAYHNIHGLLAVGNELWIGTFEHGLDVLDIRTGKVIRHYNAGPDKHSLKSNFIVTIYQTWEHEILIGTWGGLFRYNPRQDNFTAIPQLGQHIQALLEDDQGILWCCTQGNGIYYYNPLTGYGSFKADPTDESSLTDNHVNGIFQDSRRNLWFATEGGLCKYEKSKRKFTRYTIRDGLPDNLIFRVLEDRENNLWISTSKGLVCFNPDAMTIKTYKRSNGLLSDQFNYNSSYRDTDGMVYFGSMKGLIRFNPGQFLKNSAAPPVYITGIQINNKEYEVNKKNSPLKESITYTQRIELPSDQSTISIDFAALSFTMPEMNEYAYKLEGLDRDWTYLKTNRKAYFTKLPPGSYTFSVRGSNNSGVWNEKQASFVIDILPPFWASTWAYVLYAIGVISLVWFGIRYYVVRTSEKNLRKIEMLEMEKEREIYHAKIEFFTNVAHEIRTPLTLIKMPLDKLMKNPSQQQPDTKENLRTMERNTNRLIDLTNQLLDFRKTETDKFSLSFVKTDISDLIRETFSNFQLAAEEKNLQFRQELPRLSLQAFVDPEAVKKILNNLINNAVKYAQNKVYVQMLPFSSEDKVFSVEIRNDGYLIPYDQKEKIFQPFYRLKETEKEPGTGIGLPLSRSLAELHKGVLDLKKPENGMNVFSLVLPIHQDQEFVLQNDFAENAAEPDWVGLENESDPSKPVILFVEDNKEILDFIARELQTDYTVRRALNGKQALEILDQECIQMIISDIMMPVMDGLELCKVIRTNLDYSHIPIILLTAKNTLHSKIEGLEVGADAYIEKPFALEHLKAQISNLLSSRAKIKDYFSSSPLASIKSMGYSKADKNFLEQLDAIVHQNLTNMDIDVENLARLMNMSRATFYRKVKALSNLTPHGLVNISRLRKAAQLLADGDYKVYEVANMVGYTLQSNFARDFHKQFGMTPTEYVNGRRSKPV